jgi:hypothetical protein
MTNLRSQQSSGADSIRNANQITNLDEAYRDLERRMERLALVNKAMWTLLSAKAGLTDIDLRSAILEIDAADVSTRTNVCSGCGRKLAARQVRCQYCNTEFIQPDPFRI